MTDPVADLLRAQETAIAAMDTSGPWTAELEDESDLEGPVVMRDGSGAIRFIMPQRVFWEFRKGKR